MMILDILENPQTWFTLAVGVVVLVAQFLFGEKSIIRDLFTSKEKKAERDEANKSDLISKLTAKIDDLTLKYDEAIKTIHHQTLEIQRLTLQSEKNNQILDAIKKYMEDSKQPTYLLDLLKHAS